VLPTLIAVSDAPESYRFSTWAVPGVEIAKPVNTVSAITKQADLAVKARVMVSSYVAATASAS
jgi:hypothetical protein